MCVKEGQGGCVSTQRRNLVTSGGDVWGPLPPKEADVPKGKTLRGLRGIGQDQTEWKAENFSQDAF